MEDFLYDLADAIETFFTTPAAALLGTLFIAVGTALILLLLRYYEKRR